MFAALNILEPLYEASLQRMENFVYEAKGKYKFFETILAQVNNPIHPNRQYFIYKSIILNNLYGVDIMKEAVEIAKLRLFLKLVATVEVDYRKPNLGLEPLPDIDFNIRAGNTLIGFATEKELDRALIEQMDFENELAKIKEKCDIISRVFSRYKEIQLGFGDNYQHFRQAKEELNLRLNELNGKLSTILHKQTSSLPYKDWEASHRPFHWFAEFYEIIHGNGGFDVIIGNPPYVEYRKTKNEYSIKNYISENCGNLYAFVIERSNILINTYKRFGFIIPLSLVSTDAFLSIRSKLIQNTLWISNYAIRPAKLFEGVEHRLSILLNSVSTLKTHSNIYSTKYRKWSQEGRVNLLKQTTFEEVGYFLSDRGIPKLGSRLEINLWNKIQSFTKPFILEASKNSIYHLYYTRKFGHFVLFTSFVPSIQFENGSFMPPTELKFECCNSEEELFTFISYFNSTLSYWLLVTNSDCRNLNKRDVRTHPVPKFSDKEKKLFSNLGKELMTHFRENASHIRMSYPNQEPRIIEVIHPSNSYDLIKEIDINIAKSLKFTEEELDFIINYDIKYRMGKELEEDLEEID